VKSVADHSAYDKAYQKAVDWLSEAEEQLNAISCSKWNCLETVIQQQNVIKVQRCSVLLVFIFSVCTVDSLSCSNVVFLS